MARGQARILLVDDEQAVQTLLTYPLRKEGYDVVAAIDGQEALDRFAEQRFDLVVLDIMLPKLDGIEVCRRMRTRSQVPIIMLTAKGDEIDKVVGLEMGADDYITKPFSVREFRSRVKAALPRRHGRRGPGRRRADQGGRAPDRSRAPHLRGTRRAGGADLRRVRDPLGARQLGRVFSREMLLEHVWGDSTYRDPHGRRPHSPPEKKLERDAKHPEYLFTVRGSATGSGTLTAIEIRHAPKSTGPADLRDHRGGDRPSTLPLQLESSLTAEKLRRLERLGDEQGPRPARALQTRARRSRCGLVQSIGQTTESG